jgi:hypothetical protein
MSVAKPRGARERKRRLPQMRRPSILRGAGWRASLGRVGA